jgi:hypothetical protein
LQEYQRLQEEKTKNKPFKKAHPPFTLQEAQRAEIGKAVADQLPAHKCLPNQRGPNGRLLCGGVPFPRTPLLPCHHPRSGFVLQGYGSLFKDPLNSPFTRKELPIPILPIYLDTTHVVGKMTPHDNVVGRTHEESTPHLGGEPQP